MFTYQRVLNHDDALQTLSKALGRLISQGAVWINCPVCRGSAGRYEGRSVSIRLSPDGGWLIRCRAGGCAPAQIGSTLRLPKSACRNDPEKSTPKRRVPISKLGAVL